MRSYFYLFLLLTTWALAVVASESCDRSELEFRIRYLATSEGSRGEDPSPIENQYKNCSSAEVKTILKLYRKHYEKGLSQFCHIRNLQSEARVRALESPSPGLPMRLSKCFERYPELTNQYLLIFNEERKSLVARHCTEQSGYASGQSDAEWGYVKKTEMPVYCDPVFFPQYVTGYLVGWREAKEKLCGLGRAYDKGVADAKNGKSLGYPIPENCPIELQAKAMQRYKEGYSFAEPRRLEIAE